MEPSCQTTLLCMTFAFVDHSQIFGIACLDTKNRPESNFPVHRGKFPIQKNNHGFTSQLFFLCSHYLLWNMLSVASWDCGGLLSTFWHSSPTLVLTPAYCIFTLTVLCQVSSDSLCLFLLISHDLIKTCLEKKL